MVMLGGLFVFFFFSSRRRHTRSDRDWSSDVCSSDLGLDHQLVSKSQQPLHQRNQFALLQHGLSAGELDQLYGRELRDLGYDFILVQLVAACEGVFRVAPGAAQIASGETHEDARKAGEARFTLDGFIDFDEIQELTRSRSRSWCRS